MIRLQDYLQIKSSSDPKALQSLVQELQNAENESRIEVIESTCAWDEVGGPGTDLPWYDDILYFTIRDVTDNNLYILSADTYHGRWGFQRLNRHDIEYILKTGIKTSREKDDFIGEYKLSIGEYSEEYDTLGCFEKNNLWYVFWTDERNDVTITGPLSDSGMMYVLIHEGYIKSLYQKYQLSEEDEQRYLYCFYKSIDEI